MENLKIEKSMKSEASTLKRSTKLTIFSCTDQEKRKLKILKSALKEGMLLPSSQI